MINPILQQLDQIVYADAKNYGTYLILFFSNKNLIILEV